jgi:hypothetical protein
MLEHTRVECKQLKRNRFMVSVIRLISEERQRNDANPLRLCCLPLCLLLQAMPVLLKHKQCATENAAVISEESGEHRFYLLSPNKSQTAGSVCSTLFGHKVQSKRKSHAVLF